MMKEEIPKIYQDSLQLKNSIVQWDFMKYRMRQLAMKYSKEKAHEHKSRRSFLEKKVITTPYNGSRLNGKATSGLEGRVPAASKSFSCSFKKPFVSFVLDTFQAISVNFFNSSDTRRRNITPMDVEVNKICDFTIHQWNLLAISRRFTP